MANMFRGAFVFNQNIGSWDVSNVIDMMFMFYYATSFDKDVKGWNVCKVSSWVEMFRFSGQPKGTTLKPNANGKCIPCPAGTTSGSGKYVQGQNPCCLNDKGFRTALTAWFSDSTSATRIYGPIKDW